MGLQIFTQNTPVLFEFLKKKIPLVYIYVFHGLSKKQNTISEMDAVCADAFPWDFEILIKQVK